MNTKLRCLLLDDEMPGLTYLKMLCEQIPSVEIVKAFNNPQLFLEELPTLNFDCCILDIEMPNINGLQVANLLRNKLIIFTTAYKDYASEAFDLDAIDYVRKPIKKERLTQAIEKALKRMESKSEKREFIQLNTDKGKAIIFFDQLQYIKASEIDSRDKIAYLSDGLSLTLKNISFDQLKAILPSDQFCRVNKKEVIALRVVKFFSSNEIICNVVTETGEPLRVSLSEAYRLDFSSKINH